MPSNAAHQDAPTHSDGPPAVDAEGLSLTYADGTEAVRDVSLTIPRGEFFGFLGPNGAGKTTTIKLLSTLLAPTGGTARINGYDVADERAAVRGTVGYMAQHISVDTELTARENLRFACEAYGVTGGDRIDELLDLVDLADVADTPAGNFSGGMQKRLDAAMALVHDPALVFLDEPTTGLDPKARNRLWDYFERINDAGTTIFLTTQYLEEADALCDRLAVIRDGELVADDSPTALKRRVGGTRLTIDVEGDEQAVETAARVARRSGLLTDEAALETTADGLTVATSAPGDHGPDLLVALRDAGVSVTGFDVEEATLDDVFLTIADEGTPGLDAETTQPIAATPEGSR
ncbi:ABC transporter ATP-binding protein [Halomicroarcula sp. F28]|uniref:ABC transporter ATP-binding protein n=1 Tax=Haloarcula salinisoli TaxID=2487746 RepID=UPI001C72B3E7|nr:ABC transporter ATP-binding protein [Halomicroarcula salinisoli]MBX0286808.1 ABC transporter ATP-binding protein [Halomicroarcula salinisoli]